MLPYPAGNLRIISANDPLDPLVLPHPADGVNSYLSRPAFQMTANVRHYLSRQIYLTGPMPLPGEMLSGGIIKNIMRPFVISICIFNLFKEQYQGDKVWRAIKTAKPSPFCLSL